MRRGVSSPFNILLSVIVFIIILAIVVLVSVYAKNWIRDIYQEKTVNSKIKRIIEGSIKDCVILVTGGKYENITACLESEKSNIITRLHELEIPNGEYSGTDEVTVHGEGVCNYDYHITSENKELHGRISIDCKYGPFASESVILEIE